MKENGEILVARGAVTQVWESTRLEAERFYPAEVRPLNCRRAVQKLCQCLRKRFDRSGMADKAIDQGIGVRLSHM